MTDAVDRAEVMGLIDAGRDREAALRGSAVANGGDMEPLTQLDQLSTCLGGVIAGLGPDDLDRATPCDEYTVRGVLEHMIGGATTFAAAFRGDEPAEPDVSDPLVGIGAALGELFAAVSAPGALGKTIEAPFGAVPGDTFARFVVLDGLVHGWDMARATGQAYDPPDDLVAAVTDFARSAVDPLRGSGAFAAARDADADATPIDRLAAYTGRRT